MTATSIAVDHGITIEEVHLPAGTPLRARCLCGWASALLGSRPAAAEAGERHSAEHPPSAATAKTAARQHDTHSRPVTAPWGKASEAVCLCGWRSGPRMSDAIAEEDAQAHLRWAVRELIPTKDLGLIEMPSCPSWCDAREHLEAAREAAGDAVAWDVVMHRSRMAEGVLPEIRHPMGQILRDAGGRWSLMAEQALLEPGNWFSSSGAELVELAITDSGLSDSEASIKVTSGELRTLAAQAIALADRLDLAEVTR